MINRIKKIYKNLDIHTAEVVRKSAASTVVKVVGMVIGFGVSIFLGRTLGADGLGVINLSIRIVQVIMIIGLMGMPQVIIKEVSIAHSNNQWKHIGDVMHTSYLMNGFISITLSILVIILAPWISENVFHEPRLTWPLIIAVLVMPAQVFSRIFSSGMIGFRKIWQSNLVDQTLSVAVTGTILFILWIIGYEFSVLIAAIAYAIGRLFVTISTGVYWSILFKYKFKNTPIFRKLLINAVPLLIVLSTSVISANTSIVILGLFEDSNQIGIFSVALRLALLTSFFLQVTNSSVSPKIAYLFDSNRKIEMQKLLQKITGGLAVIGLFSFLLFLLLGYNILSFWGKEFSEGYFVLIILSFGQFFNIATGASGLTLVMCGFEKTLRSISIVFVLMNVFLNLFLIINFGSIGAAVATAITVAGENITKVIFIRQKVGIFIIPINRIFKSRM